MGSRPAPMRSFRSMMFAAYESKMFESICATPAVWPPLSHWPYGSSSAPHGPHALTYQVPLSWQLSVTLPAYMRKVGRRDERADRGDKPPEDAQLGHLAHEALDAHSSTEVVPMKSSHAPAKSNSYVGLPMLALSGSLLSTVRPETGSLVRPLLVHGARLGRLEEALARARVERRVHDGREAADDDGQREEGEQVGGGVGPLEARVLDALELVVPAARLEVVERAHERVDGREEHRQRDLGEKLRKHKQGAVRACGSARVDWNGRVLR